MRQFQYQNNELYVEQMALNGIAQEFGTPCYVYSHAAIVANWREFDNAFGTASHRICYAVKANSNLAILNVLANLNSGFDIVSIGELERVLAAGGDPKKVIFSGVGKKSAEIQRALEVGIYCFNVESELEIERISGIALRAKKTANIALRVNPDVDTDTHRHISTGGKENKFGIEIDRILPLCTEIKNLPNVNLIGIACHIGSQLTTLNPFLETIERVWRLVKSLQQQGFELKHINLGGGLGVCYRDEVPPAIRDYVIALRECLSEWPNEIIIEPGRAIIADTGILLTRVEYLKHSKHKNFAIVDAAMNDLIRPALYDAWQKILPVTLNKNNREELYDIVGPVCESADFLGCDRPLAIQPGELLAIDCAGAYGFSMSSNYNSRPRVAEIMVEGNKAHLIRRRETIAELFAGESIILTEQSME